MNCKKKKFIFLFSLTLLTLVLTPYITNIYISAKSITDVNQEIEKQKEKIESESAELNKKKQTSAELTKKIMQLNQNISKTKRQLEISENQIAQIGNKIKIQQKKIKKLKTKDIPIMKRRAASSLKFAQQNNNSNLTLEILASSDSDSTNDLLDKIHGTNILTQESAQSIHDLVLLLNKVKKEEDNLNKQKDKLNKSKQKLEKQQSLLSSQQQYQQNMQNTLVKQMESIEKDLSKSQDIIAAQNEQKRLYEEAGCKPHDVYGVDCGTDQMSDQGSGAWTMPLRHAVVTQSFGPSAIEPTGFHSGIDVATNAGAPVMAATGGKVLASGPTYDGGGNSVIVLHLVNGRNWVTRYCHLATISVSVGQNVRKGQTIGGEGATGNAYGAHLHFEMQPYSQYIWSQSRFTNPASQLPFPGVGGSW